VAHLPAVSPIEATGPTNGADRHELPTEGHIILLWSLKNRLDEQHTWLGKIDTSKGKTQCTYTCYKETDEESKWILFTAPNGSRYDNKTQWPPASTVKVLSCVRISKQEFEAMVKDANGNDINVNDHRYLQLLMHEKNLRKALLKDETTLRTLMKEQLLAGPTESVRRNDPYTIAPLEDALDVLYEPINVNLVEATESMHDEEDSDIGEETLEDLADRLHTLRGDNVNSGFQRGNMEPPLHVAQVTGVNLLRLLQCMQPPSHRLVWQGLVKSTHNEHLRAIKTLCADLLSLDNVTLETISADRLIIEILYQKFNQRKWRWSTLIKYLASLQGALSLLPLYRMAPPIICDSIFWRQGLKAAGRGARIQLPRQPKAISKDEMTRAIQEEDSTPIAVAMMLSWATAARVGCILKLCKTDIQWTGETTLAVIFRRGKGALLRGTPYTIHTDLPPNFVSRIKNWIEKRKTWVFPSSFTPWMVTTALRRIDKSFEARSIRRGALQHLAAKPGITEEILLMFSGHSNAITLRRYLDYGIKATHIRTAMLTAR
jgi:integrase